MARGQAGGCPRAYAALPVPTNRDEAWRYTNLRGFDPDAYDRHPADADASDADAAGGRGVRDTWPGRSVDRPELVEQY